MLAEIDQGDERGLPQYFLFDHYPLTQVVINA